MRLSKIAGLLMVPVLALSLVACSTPKDGETKLRAATPRLQS